MKNNQTEIIAKADNTFIMLLNGIMFDKLERVKHKVSENIYNYYANYIATLKEQDIRQMYDELNVKSTEIISEESTADYHIVKIHLVSRYLDYQVKASDFSYLSGNKDKRVEKDNYLTFQKKNGSTEEIVKKCPGCGANINFNSNGICEYCNTPYDTYNHDYVLVEINNIK